MTPVRGRGKRVPHGKTAWSHAAMAVQGARDGISDWQAFGESDSGLFFSIRFGLTGVNNCGGDELWTNES
ncbi:hypothetical protein BST63_06985 [Bradyrhizobium canariense]|jgi:hypothetical protein|uniref:Uncharacterized protein n=1 Tax=Bradyrhizobium canariense TaxID=255045 RepID=A0ABX3X8Z0_9BRAD|nr:hypothetical protein BSZ23_06345 [Bradyrhizobium canariense]OSI94968.1 hypothetical protein BSZ25_05690 [Bradyrhizobium canariense]OSJ17900.1 hypothetical protein BSR47_08420 [Bradyrhizobium canariense]OSJ32669.1 hypothetical protein BST63_06985 [Bradyrhizobium canariense]